MCVCVHVSCCEGILLLFYGCWQVSLFGFVLLFSFVAGERWCLCVCVWGGSLHVRASISARVPRNRVQPHQKEEEPNEATHTHTTHTTTTTTTKQWGRRTLTRARETKQQKRRRSTANSCRHTCTHAHQIHTKHTPTRGKGKQTCV